MLGSSKGLVVRVESEGDLLVLERVLLLNVLPLLGWVALWLEDGLDLVRVDESGDVGVGHHVGWEDVSRLHLWRPDAVEEGECGGSPDAESSEVTTWGQLEEVERSDVCELDTWDVSECSDETLVLVVDDKGSSSLGVTSVSELSLSCSQLSGVGNLEDISVSLVLLEEGNGLLRLLE